LASGSGRNEYVLFRNFSVKELPWCSPKDSPVRRHPSSSPSDDGGDDDDNSTSATNRRELQFGVVAAQTNKTRIIGVNGKLPFANPITRDRRIFESLTSGRILIIGRKTFSEDQVGDLNHIRHAKHCIVITQTIRSIEELLSNTRTASTINTMNDDTFKVATSFEEALQVASELIPNIHIDEDDNKNNNSSSTSSSSSSSSLLCWVAGGERLYEEALKHSSVSELHLSTVDVRLPCLQTNADVVSKFPAKYRWDHNFKLLSEQTFDETETEPSFVYSIYKRLERNKPR
jgi:dihydrofolate reductase